MPDLWMPGAARHPLGNTGVMDGGPARAVWHITSNDKDWTFANELGWFTGGGAAVAPHLLWDPFTGEMAQLFPADSRSLSLQNDGAVRTNRTGKYCIQIETVFTAGETVGGKKYATVRDTPAKGLDQIMAWLRSLGIPDVWPGGAPTGFVRDTVSADMWQNAGGHYGHHQIRGNSHVDPGPMPDLFTTIQPEENGMALTDADKKDIAEAVWGFKLTSPTAAAGADPLREAGTFLRYGDAKYAVLLAQFAELKAVEAGQSAALTALAKLVGTGVDTAVVVAAVQAAIASATVKVSVDVTGPGAS